MEWARRPKTSPRTSTFFDMLAKYLAAYNKCFYKLQKKEQIPVLKSHFPSNIPPYLSHPDCKFLESKDCSPHFHHSVECPAAHCAIV